MTTPQTVLSRFLTGETFEVTGAVMMSSPTIEAIQRKGEEALYELLGNDAAPLIESRQKRDGHTAHVTVVGPPETRKVLEEFAVQAITAEPTLSKGKAKEAAKDRLKALVADWKVGSIRNRGLGKAEAGDNEAYFMVLDWPEGRKLRESLGLDGDGQDFHVTVGFKGADVHGVRKNQTL